MIEERLSDLEAQLRRSEAECERLRRRVRELEQGERLFQTLVETSTDNIVRYDREGRHLFLSPSAVETSGRPIAWWLGKAHRELGWPKEVYEPVEAGIFRTVETGEPQTVEVGAELHNGQRFLEFRMNPEKVNGRVESVIAVVRDVTERKATAAALEQQADVLRRIVEYAPVGIAYFNDQLDHVWCNDYYAEKLQVRSNDVIGRNPYESLGPDTEAQVGEMFQRALAGQAQYGTAFPFKQHVNGVERWTYWDFTYQPVPREDGAIAGVLVVAQEVSERQENDRLVRERIEVLETSDRMLALVADLLDMSLIQAGKLSVRCQPNALAPLVAEVLAELAPQAAAAGVTLTQALEPGLPAILADATRTTQVLSNLIGNAIKFTPVGGTIAIRAVHAGGFVRCEVVDTGIGIAPDDRPKLFHRFSQVDMSQTRQAGGTGLGLSITKALVEAQGGEIGVESALAVGSTFWFTSPVAASR